ncbi:MAG: DUF763 domain-containing protein, partial [Candidatus Odinarchaeia archaeon]
MKRTGLTILPLHGGKAPAWLISKMIKLADAIFEVLLDQYNPDEILKRLSDPFWFQALSCVLGFDWHSSGTTTVTIGVLKSVLKPEKHGLAVVGGKGAAARNALTEIENLAEILDFKSENLEIFKKASRLTAKVDNAAIQDGFQIYHHSMILTGDKWVVIQQGLEPEMGVARRYHWLSDKVESFVEEPHSSIISDTKKDVVLDMTSKESDSCRDISVDLVKDNPKHLRKYFRILKDSNQKTLFSDNLVTKPVPVLKMPRRIDWAALEQAYELQPSNYEELLLIKGFGPGLIRALALISELIWSKPPSWRDPIKFSFAHGGKDGVPYPVNTRRMI